MAKYKVLSEEGANRYGADIGETIDTKIDDEELRAVTCAGWIEHVTTKPAKEDKS